MKLKEYPHHLRHQLSHAVSAWSQKQGLSDKITSLNQRANANPKRTAALLMVVVLFITFIGVLPIFFEQSPKQPIVDFASIEATALPIQATQKIEDKKILQSTSLRDYLSHGQILKRELDSLLALTHKSSRDSLEIVRKHKQLEYIVNNLNEKD